MSDIVICEPAPKCGDPHVLRWHCMRGHALDDAPAVAGVCHIKKCAPMNPGADL